jgi:hypothetical protein
MRLKPNIIFSADTILETNPNFFLHSQSPGEIELIDNTTNTQVFFWDDYLLARGYRLARGMSTVVRDLKAIPQIWLHTKQKDS